MATLTVWKFDFPTAADEAESTLESLSKQGLITVHDAATISWAWGSKPKTRQLQSLTGRGTLGGAFWGLLFGLLFNVASRTTVFGYWTGSIRRPRQARSPSRTSRWSTRATAGR